MRAYLGRLPQKARIALAVLAVLVAVGIIAAAVLLGGEKDVDPSKGVQVIQKMEQTKTDAIEEEIEELNSVEDEKRRRAESGMTSTETFTEADAIVFGSTVAKGFSDNGVLSASSVIAQEEMLLTDEEELQTLIDSASGLDPKTLFIFLGSDDIPATDGDVELFREEYKKIVVEIQRTFPDATIYAALIPPVDEAAYTTSAAYREVDQYNSALRELCRENNLLTVDTSACVSSGSYGSDGVTLDEAYYSACALHLIETAGL